MGEYKDKIQGEAKDVAGKLTGNKKREWEGKAQKVKGKVEGAGNRIREETSTPPEQPMEPTARQPRRTRQPARRGRLVLCLGLLQHCLALFRPVGRRSAAGVMACRRGIPSLIGSGVSQRGIPVHHK